MRNVSASVSGSNVVSLRRIRDTGLINVLLLLMLMNLLLLLLLLLLMLLVLMMCLLMRMLLLMRMRLRMMLLMMGQMMMFAFPCHTHRKFANPFRYTTTTELCLWSPISLVHIETLLSVWSHFRLLQSTHFVNDRKKTNINQHTRSTT